MKFSIILPTYNRAELFLKRAIDSVVRQSYKDWELIIVDNNSTDNTKDLVGSYSDNNIRLYSIQNEGNIAKSRNLGISKAKGEFIAFLDSDDFWHRDKLKISLDYLKKYKLNGLCHSEYWLYETGETEIRHYGSTGFSYNNLLKNGNNLSLSAVIVHSDILKDVKGFSEDIDYITAEDYDLWLKLAKNNYKIKFIKNIMGTFRIHKYSESSDVDKNIKAICSVIKNHCKDNDIYKNRINIYIANAYILAGKIFQLNDLKNKSLRYYIKSIKLNPIRLKPYYMLLSLLFPIKILKKIK